MSAAKRIMSQREVAVGMPPNHEECQGAWLKLVRLTKSIKALWKAWKGVRRQNVDAKLL